MNGKSKNPWYSAGLHFDCLKCGRCCSGPAEGYIWAAEEEILLIAEHLKMPVDDLKHQFLKRVGRKMTIIEDTKTNDCIFLKKQGSQKQCIIYPVRPSQCRNWPFWDTNLISPYDWNMAATKCPGINRGTFYSLDDVESKKENKPWYNCHPEHSEGSHSIKNQKIITEVEQIYSWLNEELIKNKEFGLCPACGKCCDFRSFGHRLYVTTPELIYFADKISVENLKQMPAGKCAYQVDNKCGVYDYRFAGCRIFSCKGNPDFQSQLTESVLKKFKSICEKYEIPYQYSDFGFSL